MKALWQRYLNEIIGLTIMAMMTFALVAGEAGASAEDTVAGKSRNMVEIRLTISD